MSQSNTQTLSSRRLHRSIAAQLKLKEVIIPRSYDAATVLFCQLVDFPQLLSISNAEQVTHYLHLHKVTFLLSQVIAFLNDVFFNFDEVIRVHDAYKVISISMRTVEQFLSGGNNG